MQNILLLLLALFFTIASPVSAQTESAGSAPAAPPSDVIKIMPVPPDSAPSIFGQNHYYTVTLRGNGEAVVTFKAILSNTGNTPLETVSLKLPENVSPADVIAYQVKQEPQCIRYIPQPLPTTRSQDPVQYKEECAEYQEPNYQYIYGKTTYHRIQNEAQNNTVLLKLPLPVEPNKNGSYFVYYRTNTLTEKDAFGAYTYKFETLKTEDNIHSLQIGISTDPDYMLRGVKGEVNYGSGVSMAALPAADRAERAVSNASFDQFYNQIGSGMLTKQASDLAPNETYKIDGMYAESQAKLYGKEITTAVILVLLFVILTIVLSKVLLKKLARKKADKPEDAVLQLKNQNKTFLIALSISFISMLLVCLYTFGVYAITQLLNPNMYYGGDTMILQLFIFAISGLVYLFFFFAPAVGMAIKKGLGWGLVTFSATVIWAILFLLVLFALLFFFTPKGNGYPRPMPFMSVMEGRAAPAADLSAPVPAQIAPPPPVEPDTTQTGPVEEKTIESGLVPPQTTELRPLRVETQR